MGPKKIVLIGASTGGPGLIEKIAASLPKSICVPIIIAQHMDRLSLNSFAGRIQRVSNLNSIAVSSTTEVKDGSIYILCDTAVIIRKSGSLFLTPRQESGFYHPTIDTLFESAAALSCAEITAVILSGIGSDGAKGICKLKAAGHQTIAQDEESSVVFGMPKAAAESGCASFVYPIEKIAKKIEELAQC